MMHALDVNVCRLIILLVQFFVCSRKCEAFIYSFVVLMVVHSCIIVVYIFWKVEFILWLAFED